MGKKAFNETEDFKKLSKEWEAKLKAAEFEDIIPIKNEYSLESQVFGANETTQKNGIDNQLLCEEILSQFKFKKEFYRRIIELHMNGRTNNEICLDIEREYGRTLTQQGVNKVINRTKAKYLEGRKK